MRVVLSVGSSAKSDTKWRRGHEKNIFKSASKCAKGQEQKKKSSLTGVAAVVLLGRWLAERWSASDRTVAHQAQLGVIVAGSQDRGGHLAAVIVSADAVVTRTKAAAVSSFYSSDVAGAAGRRTRPVRVVRLDDSTGLDGVPRWGWLGSITLVGGNFRKVRERGRRSGCLYVDHGRKKREGFVVRNCVGGG